MRSEKTLMITGKEYRDIKEALERNEVFKFNVGTEREPYFATVTDIYLDTDPEFTRNYAQYAKINDEKHVQVKLEYEG